MRVIARESESARAREREREGEEKGEKAGASRGSSDRIFKCEPILEEERAGVF